MEVEGILEGEIPDSAKKDLLRNDKNALRACILYEFLQKKPVFEAYKNFCKTIGDDLMEYREFDFWFYKIGKENADLSGKLIWNPDSLTLSNMPLKVVDTILENVEPIDRLPLGKVSQSLRSLTKAIGHGFKKILTKSECFEDGLINVLTCDPAAIGKVFDPNYEHNGANEIVFEQNYVKFAVKCEERSFGIKRAGV
ncbi:F-box domain-containing protein [Caenorhabditis elegans]|uniref:F-box domain-containing protein n=1 Tax=Caenorhabditis elegans TaxID=6239 RepID=G2HK11_CAEEL|nr:F-box domain-containing protein [Caenorhabditis elegans]CCD31136.1 F-box domain-containing protein [Caenorhabditis elegans]|eukprot:NP_001256785.1 Uncharacterized protein CELE_Y37H2A.12 [Caenorhabditis elegans]